MTRKDYKLIAAALKRAGERCDADKDGDVWLAASEIADALKADNPRFDHDRFMTAALRHEGEQDALQPL